MDSEEAAATYALAGERDKAMQWLEKGFAERSEGMTRLQVFPHFDSLRDDPRFQDLIKRVGFAE